MTKTRPLLSRLPLLLAAPLILADGPPPNARAWLLEEPVRAGSTVELDLTRAHVREERGTGPLRISIIPRGEGAAEVRLEVERSEDRVRVYDVYPSASASSPSRECEPPVGERGAFWRDPETFDVVIELPPGVSSDVRVNESVEASKRP